MNFYQRLGALFARCYGFYMLIDAAWSFIAVITRLVQGLTMEQVMPTFVVGFISAIAGFLFFRASEPIGRVLGKGLGELGDKSIFAPDDI